MLEATAHRIDPERRRRRRWPMALLGVFAVLGALGMLLARRNATEQRSGELSEGRLGEETPAESPTMEQPTRLP